MAWAVLEFDGGDALLWSHDGLDETEARGLYDHVAAGRHQRSDVVLRTRAVALQHDGMLVEAKRCRPSRRAPAIGNARLRHLDPDLRERIIGLELLATRLARAAFRKDGRPRVGPGWRVVRGVACEVLDLVRGAASSSGDTEPGWWLQEWSCRCSQVERQAAALHDACPYHPAARRAHGPRFVEHGW